MAEELLDKIPTEKRWLITAKILITFALLRGVKTVMPLLGKGEGIISPIWGWEKWGEINQKIFGNGGRRLYPMIKEMFNISVEDAVGAAKLHIVATTLLQGPEFTPEIVEATPERVVSRTTKCSWMERYKEFEVDPEDIVCVAGHQTWGEEGLKAIDPKLTWKVTKAMPWGDPYCEHVIEFE